MKKNSFISGIAFASVFFVSLNANALEELQTIYKIVDQNAIKKYVQQFKPEQERINKNNFRYADIELQLIQYLFKLMTIKILYVSTLT